MRHSGPLTHEQVECFFEQGFVLLPEVFSKGDVDQMRAAFERLQEIAGTLPETGMYRGSQFVLERTPHEAGRNEVRIHRIVWCGAAEPVLSRFGMDRRLLAMAAQILGSNEMNQLINQAHFKQPGDGVEFPWHQDSTHRRYGQEDWRDVNGRGSYVQTVTAIDAIDEHNGPLRLLPGSCKLGHVAPAPDGGLPSCLDQRNAVAATMTAGSVLMFGPYTYHSSPPNDSTRPRRIFINGFASPGANSRVYPGAGAGRLVSVPS